MAWKSWISKCVALVLMAGLVVVGLLLRPPASPGVPLNDDQARVVVGGDTMCGNVWVVGSVNCPAGTALCKTTTERCETATVVTLVKSSTGKEIESGSWRQACFVCVDPFPGTVCNYVNKITSTKETTCSTTPIASTLSLGSQ